MLRLAFCGSARAARWYPQAIARLPDVEFAGVAHPDADDARAAAALLDAPRTAANLTDLLASEAACDAVVVESPLESRAGDAREAADAGKHALVAGPIAPTARQALELDAAFRAAGCHLMPGLFARFGPGVAAIKQRVAAGKLGATGLVRLHRWRPRPVAPDLSENTLRDYLASDLDLVAWIFGSLPQAIYAQARAGEGDRWDYVQLHLQMNDGGMALIDHASTLPGETGYASLSVIGARGAAYADDHRNQQLLYRGERPTAVRTGEPEWIAVRDGLAEFAFSIAEGRDPQPRGTAAVDALRMAEAAHASLPTGRPALLAGTSES